MLKNKQSIILMVLVFILSGCNSDKVTDEVIDTSINIENVSPDPDKNATSTEESTENQELRLSKPAKVETKPSNWYIRLVAEDPSKAMISVGAQLGELEEGDTVEKHTLKALSPFGGSYLDVVFVDPDGVAPGAYKVNFHTYTEGMEDHWRFSVRTDDTAADIQLTWQGLYVLTPYTDKQNRQRYEEYRSLTNPLIKNMKLIDSSNGKEIAATIKGKAQTYSFNMEGLTERTFEWVVQTEEVNIPAQTRKSSRIRTKVDPKEAVLQKTEIMKKKAEMFDLDKPPMIKEEMLEE